MSLKAVNIIWDTDEDKDVKKINLPNDMELPFGMFDHDEISEYISNETGFCHSGFDLIACLCTIPDNEVDYCKYFEVPVPWLSQMIKHFNNVRAFDYMSLMNFLDDYTWTDTYLIYCSAKEQGQLLSEGITPHW